MLQQSHKGRGRMPEHWQQKYGRQTEHMTYEPELSLVWHFLAREMPTFFDNCKTR